MLKNNNLKLLKMQGYGCALLLCFATFTWAEKELTTAEFTEKYSLKDPNAGKPVYNPMTQARIRFYGRTGTKIYIQHSFDCENRKQGIRDYVSNDGGWDAFKSYARLTMNTSLDMPKTEILKTTLTNTFSTYLYISHKELALDANQPINLHGFVIGSEAAKETNPQSGTANTYPSTPATVIEDCKNAQASFIPKSGHDYEVLGTKKNGKCQFTVYDLKNKQAVTLNPLYQCPSKTSSWKFWKNE